MKPSTHSFVIPCMVCVLLLIGQSVYRYTHRPSIYASFRSFFLFLQSFVYAVHWILSIKGVKHCSRVLISSSIYSCNHLPIHLPFIYDIDPASLLAIHLPIPPLIHVYTNSLSWPANTDSSHSHHPSTHLVTVDSSIQVISQSINRHPSIQHLVYQQHNNNNNNNNNNILYYTSVALKI